MSELQQALANLLEQSKQQQNDNSEDPELRQAILDLLSRPQLVQADGQTVRTHDLPGLIDAHDRLTGRTCTSANYIQKIRSGGAFGA